MGLRIRWTSHFFRHCLSARRSRFRILARAWMSCMCLIHLQHCRRTQWGAPAAYVLTYGSITIARGGDGVILFASVAEATCVPWLKQNEQFKRVIITLVRNKNRLPQSGYAHISTWKVVSWPPSATGICLELGSRSEGVWPRSTKHKLIGSPLKWLFI